MIKKHYKFRQVIVEFPIIKKSHKNRKTYWEYKLIQFVFVIKNAFISKWNGRTDQLKYSPSLIMTFSHLSGNFRIPSRKNFSFEAIHLLKRDRTNLYFVYYKYFLGLNCHKGNNIIENREISSKKGKNYDTLFSVEAQQ